MEIIVMRIYAYKINFYNVNTVILFYLGTINNFTINNSEYYKLWITKQNVSYYSYIRLVKSENILHIFYHTEIFKISKPSCPNLC